MRDPESEGSDDEDDEFRDMEGKMYTAAGNEVIACFSLKQCCRTSS